MKDSTASIAIDYRTPSPVIGATVRRRSVFCTLVPLFLFLMAGWMPGCNNGITAKPAVSKAVPVWQMYMLSVIGLALLGYGAVASQSWGESAQLFGAGAFAVFTICVLIASVQMVLSPMIARRRALRSTRWFHLRDLTLWSPAVLIVIDFVFNDGRFFLIGFYLLAVACVGQWVVLSTTPWITRESLAIEVMMPVNPDIRELISRSTS